MSEVEINQWCKKNNSDSWKGLDPYSSLEDIGDTTSDEIANQRQGDNDAISEPEIIISPIRSRLHTRIPVCTITVRPRRSSSNNVNYTNKYDDLDLPPSPTRKKVNHRAKPGPSDDRIAARSRKSVTPS